MSATGQLIYLGTYTPKDNSSRGIYAVRLDTATGALSAPVLVAETTNPTFLALAPNGATLYALHETAAEGARVEHADVARIEQEWRCRRRLRKAAAERRVHAVVGNLGHHFASFNKFKAAMLMLKTPVRIVGSGIG